jgi:PAS domain-containing protein
MSDKEGFKRLLTSLSLQPPITASTVDGSFQKRYWVEHRGIRTFASDILCSPVPSLPGLYIKVPGRSDFWSKMSSRVPTSTETVGLHTHAAAQRITTLSPNTDKDINSTPKRTLAWKGTVEHLLGFPVDDIPTTESWWLARIHPDDLLDVVTSLSKILAPAPERPYASEARIWAHNYRFRHAGGEYLLVAERSTVDRDEGGNVLSMTSTIFDAEKRRVERKAHREFLDERNQFALVANNTPSGIWMMECVLPATLFLHELRVSVGRLFANLCDSPQGYTTYMNNAAESITGFSTSLE